MIQGWYFNIGVKEYFIESNRQNKTRNFIEKILDVIKAPITDANISFIQSRLLKANMEIKHCLACADLGVKEHDYYNIYGDNFSSYGSGDINDGLLLYSK